MPTVDGIHYDYVDMHGVKHNRCHECDEMKVDPDEFTDGLICTMCWEAKFEEEEDDDRF